MAQLFAKVPEHLLDDDAVSDRAVRLFALLDRYAGKDGKAYPYRSTLAARLRCSVKSIDRSLGELVAVGAIVVESGASGGRNNHYRLAYVTSDAPPGTPVTHPAVTGDAPVRQEGRTPYVTSDAPPGTPVTHRKRAKKESQEGEPRTEAAPAGSWLEIVEPNGPVAIRRITTEIIDAAAATAKDHGAPFTPSDRRTLRPVIEEALSTGYDESALTAAVAAAPFRTRNGVMGELRKARQKPTSVGRRVIDEASEWVRQEGA